MSREHKIIAPTKSCDLKNKTINALSKYMNKNYHVAQRYQVKWMQNLSTNLINETNAFKEALLSNEASKKRPSSSTHSSNNNNGVNKKLKSSSSSNNNNDQQQQQQHQSTSEMYDCSDNDNLGLTSFLSHTLDNSSVIIYNFSIKFFN